MMVVENEYEIGERVYLSTDKDQYPRVIFGFIITKSEILYKCACGTQTSDHYGFELSKEVNVLLKSE